MSGERPTVALVHATQASIGPALAAFADRFPGARLWNLLDDLLISEAEEAGGVTPALRARMLGLIRHAVDGGADAVLLTCSMYGPVALEAAADHRVPVLSSDQALFDQVASHEPPAVAVLGPVRAGVADTVERLRDRIGDVRVTGIVVDGSRAAAGDTALLGRLVADEARRAEPGADLIVLGQFSLAPAHSAVEAAVSVPVLSPPRLAVDVLREHFEARP